MNLDLNGIAILEAVVKYGGFGRAAKRLHRSQSSVSHQIGKLEEQLGVSLFSRDDYKVRLTPAGHAILAEGRRLLAQMERVHSVARQFSHGWEPALLIVIDGILPLRPTLSAVRALTKEGAPTRIQVRVEFLSGVQRRFESDRADLMLVVDYTADPFLREEALPHVDCVLCVGSTHPLAHAKSVSLAELQDHVELSVQHSNEEQESDRHLFGCERRVYVSSFLSKREALLLGVGFGWMPLHLIHDELKAGTVRELHYVGGSRYRFTPRVVYRAEDKFGRAALQFLTLLRAAEWEHATWPEDSQRK
jgi:DNA-binding transcriptional LysR family regulator